MEKICVKLDEAFRFFVFGYILFIYIYIHINFFFLFTNGELFRAASGRFSSMINGSVQIGEDKFPPLHKVATIHIYHHFVLCSIFISGRLSFYILAVLFFL